MKVGIVSVGLGSSVWKRGWSKFIKLLDLICTYLSFTLQYILGSTSDKQKIIHSK